MTGNGRENRVLLSRDSVAIWKQLVATGKKEKKKNKVQYLNITVSFLDFLRTRSPAC